MSTLNPTVKKVLPWTPLIGALILGLILGLLIGWVWWPVEWTNATVADLSPAAQAAYVGAVAEAYRFDGTQTATQRMQSRLAALGNDADAAITAAIDYYRSQPVPDEVQVANLALLATDLGIPIDASMIAPDTAPAPADTAPAVDDAAAPAAASDSAAADEDTGGGWGGVFPWLLAVVLSLGLIGAGFYLLMRLRGPRDLTDGMKEPPAPTLPGEMRPPAPVATGGGNGSRTTSWSSSPKQTAPAAVKADDDLSFDEEDEEEPAVRFSGASGELGAPDADDDDTPTTPRYASARPDTAIYSAPAGSSLYTGSSYDAPVSSPPAPAAAAPAPAKPAPAARSVPADAPPVDIDALTPRSWAPVDPGAPPAKGANGKASPAATAATAAAVAAAPTAAPATKPAVKPATTDITAVVTTGVPVSVPVARPAAKPAARQPIATYTLQYFAGMPDYIEAENINDPASGAYLGECGMAVSERNPLLQPDPNQVIALDVWMHDTLDAREDGRLGRVLLSPYAVARNMAQSFPGAATLEARKGARFELQGANLLLAGELLDVEYDAAGVFKSAKVQLNILPRK